MTETVEVQERGRTLAFTFEDLMRYHGPGSPGGVAVAFQALRRGFALLSPDEPPRRREVAIATAFRGPGARDGFEMVTRAVTGERFTVDAGLERPDRGRVLERFVFAIGYAERRATLLLRAGYVTEEFIDLARREGRSADEEAHLDALKADLAARVLAAAPVELYDVADA